MATGPNVSALLTDWSNGDQAAREKLIPLVYDQLHRLAHRHMAQERPDHSLQATAVVNEVYLQLVDQRSVRWQNRAQFFALASQMMRHILVDYARKRNRAKRGRGFQRVQLEAAAIVADSRASDWLALDCALKELAEIDARKSQVVELRYFGGLSVEETSEVLNISPVTVMRDWQTAKAWLYRSLSGAEEQLSDGQ